jgi:site-specific recombinase XerC
MKVELKNRYANARLYQQQPCKAMPKDKFITNLKEGVKFISPDNRKTTNIFNSHVNLLDGYLDKYSIKSVVPDENFFDTLWKRMQADTKINGKRYSVFTAKKTARSIRKLVNAYLYEKLHLLKRKILLEVEYGRYERFFKLTKLSQDAVIWFEDNGRVVKAMPVLVNNKSGKEMLIKMIHRVTDKKLLTNTNYTKIQLSLLFLRVIGKNGFEQVNKADVGKFEEYCDSRQLKKKADYLADVATFFANIHSKGFIESNPFAYVSLKKNGTCVRRDFIPKEGIERLLDLSTVDFNDKQQIRDRAIALMFYDSALRINEVLSLKCSDIRKDADGEMYLLLRSEVQKGAGKPEETMYFFFEQTKEIINKYLSVRDKFTPKVEHLFVSRYGTPSCHPHCRKIFKLHCQGLGIKTFYNNSPSPHQARHSFGTLNISPLGLSLGLYEIVERFRHTKPEIAKRHYIHNNPYLVKEKYNILKKRMKKKSNIDILNEIPLADIEHWLSETLEIDSRVIKAIRRKHQAIFVLNKGIDKKNEFTKIDSYISEKEAFERLEHLAISIHSLRKYCVQNNTAVNGTGQYSYKKDFINELAENWVGRPEVMHRLKIDYMGFHRLVNDNRLKRLKIGRQVFVHKKALFA